MTNSYSLELHLPVGPDQVLAAIHSPATWWSEGITGPTADVGDEFDYRYGTVHHSRIRISESSSERVVWLILENEFGFLEGEDEWIGTRCVFDVAPTESGTVLRFTHDGLFPHLACYDVCSQGWDHYVGSSLVAAITDGRGTPNAKGTARTSYEASLPSD
jgi:hypothetical protein